MTLHSRPRRAGPRRTSTTGGRTSSRCAASWRPAARSRRSASAAWCPASSCRTRTGGRSAAPSSRTTPGPSREIDELPGALEGARVLERTGSAITQQSVGPTLLWLQRHEPEAWARTRTVAGSYDTIVAAAHRASGPSSRTGRSRAGSTTSRPGLGAGHPARRPASTRRSCRRSGARTRSSARSRAAAAAATGLRAGTPVVAGSADHVASAFAAGLVARGRPARQARRRRRHPAHDGRAARGLAPVPRLPPGARPVPAQRLHGRVRAASSAGSRPELAGGAPLAALDAEAEACRPGRRRRGRPALHARREDAAPGSRRAGRVRRADPGDGARPPLPRGAGGDRVRRSATTWTSSRSSARCRAASGSPTAARARPSGSR